jgi:hypothetical protein
LAPEPWKSLGSCSGIQGDAARCRNQSATAGNKFKAMGRTVG